MVIWIISILIIIVFLYNMPLKFKIYYEYKGNINKLDITLQTLYGLIKYKINIPSLKAKLEGKSTDKPRKRKAKGLESLKILWIKELILIVKFDCYDAAITGIIAGVLYFIESNILLLTLKCKKVENYRFIIQPLFKQKNLIDIKFSCIFQFKIGQIIYERLKLFLKI